MRSIIKGCAGMTLLRLLIIAIFFGAGVSELLAESTRAERRNILDGNKLYRENKFADAKQKYRLALKENDNSDVARFNMALCDAKLADLSKDNDSIANSLRSESIKSFAAVAKLGKSNASLASKANYNLGNLEFEKENYQGAIQYYKQALRLDPNFNEARRNLRIAQLKLPKNDQDQNQDQKKDQDKEKEKEKDKKENQDNSKDSGQDKQEQDQQPQPNPNELSEQAAEQILNAVENKEQAARQTLNKRGQKSTARGSRLKKW